MTVIEDGPAVPKAAVDDAAAGTSGAGRCGRAGRKVAMLALRGYLVVSVVLLIVKAVQLGGG